MTCSRSPAVSLLNLRWAATAYAIILVAAPCLLAQQCPVSDHLFVTGLGQCCTPVLSTVPQIPAVAVDGIGACLGDCDLLGQFPVTTVLTPVQTSSDEWLIGFDLYAPTLGFRIRQNLYAKYVRTWIEPPFGQETNPIQVWRFLVNGDLIYSFDRLTLSAPGVPQATISTSFQSFPPLPQDTVCGIPLSVYPPYNLPVHFVGNIDFAKRCAFGPWNAAYALTHFCPAESHGTFSQQPIPNAGTWPAMTHHFIAPDNFNFAPVAPPSGANADGLGRTSRGYTIPGPQACFPTDRIGSWPFPSWGLSNVVADCPCSSSANPTLRYVHQNLTSQQRCQNGPWYAEASALLASQPTGIPSLPTGMRALVLGTYGTAPNARYPEGTTISVYLGVLNSPAFCPSTAPSLHAVTGVGMTGGYARSFWWGPFLNPPLPLASVDLQNMLFPSSTGFSPGFGAQFVSDRVWSFWMHDPTAIVGGPPPPPPPPR